MSPSLRLWAYLLAISALWGSCFPLIQTIVQFLPPFILSAVRGFLAAFALFLWLACRGQLARLERTVVRQAAVLGMLNGWVPNLVVAVSRGRIESRPAAVIQAGGPLVALLLSLLLLRAERPAGMAVALRVACGFGLGFAGVLLVLLLLAQGGANPRRRAADGRGGGELRHQHGLRAVGADQGVRARCARPAVRLRTAFPSARAVAGAVGRLGQARVRVGLVAVFAVFGSAIPLTLSLRLLSFAPARDAALVGYLQPIWAVALATTRLGKRPGFTVLFGGAVVLFGIWLAGRPPERRA